MLLIVRAIVILIWFLTVSFGLCLLFFFRPFHPNNSHLVAQLLKWLPLKILRMKVTVENLEEIDEAAPCIYICNHQSNFDLFVIGVAVPRRTVSVGKKSIKYIPFFGQVYWLAGNILIDRGRGRKAMETLEKIREWMLQKKMSVWIFPEGTRSKGRGLLPFKKGAFYMAIKAQLPIKPIVSSSYHNLLDLNRWKEIPISMAHLPAISTEGKSEEDVVELMNLAREQMKAKLEELDQKVQAILDE